MMEQIIDAIKKRAWRSAWLALKAFFIGLLLGLFSSIKSMIKTMLVLFLCGWAVGFGGYFGLSSALDADLWLGGNQHVFIEVSPIRIVKAVDDEQ